MAGPSYYTGNMNIALNEDWVVPFVYSYVDTNGNITGPVDLTGSTIKMELRIAETDEQAIVSVFSPNGGIFIGSPSTAGQFWIAMTRADHLFRLFPGSFFVDLVRLMPSGYQERIWEGVATVVEGSTR
jgi:hypothetical protein